MGRTAKLLIEGVDLSGWMNEAGGHRVQRVPRNERQGRVHSSTVTVSVIHPGAGADLELVRAAGRRSEQDFTVEWYSGSGAGGQHRNKHQNSCRYRHLPTGLMVSQQCRKREESLRKAREEMLQRLDLICAGEVGAAENGVRSDQIGSGMRADKRRTYRFQEDRVVDHLTGKMACASKVLKGNFDLLW